MPPKKPSRGANSPVIRMGQAKHKPALGRFAALERYLRAHEPRQSLMAEALALVEQDPVGAQPVILQAFRANAMLTAENVFPFYGFIEHPAIMDIPRLMVRDDEINPAERAMVLASFVLSQVVDLEDALGWLPAREHHIPAAFAMALIGLYISNDQLGNAAMALDTILESLSTSSFDATIDMIAPEPDERANVLLVSLFSPREEMIVSAARYLLAHPPTSQLAHTILRLREQAPLSAATSELLGRLRQAVEAAGDPLPSSRAAYAVLDSRLSAVDGVGAQMILLERAGEHDHVWLSGLICGDGSSDFISLANAPEEELRAARQATESADLGLVEVRLRHLRRLIEELAIESLRRRQDIRLLAGYLPLLEGQDARPFLEQLPMSLGSAAVDDDAEETVTLLAHPAFQSWLLPEELLEPWEDELFDLGEFGGEGYEDRMRAWLDQHAVSFFDDATLRTYADMLRRQAQVLQLARDTENARLAAMAASGVERRIGREEPALHPFLWELALTSVFAFLMDPTEPSGAPSAGE